MGMRPEISGLLPTDTSVVLEALKQQTETIPRSMPPSFYTNASMLPAEIDNLFVNGWVCVGRADEVPEIGDYYTLEYFEEPIIVTRTDKDTVAVLSNVCRHRGSKLVEGRGNNKRFTCPYHRWSYALDGKLLAAPIVDKTEGFDKKACRLPSFRVHNWFGWVFVNLSGNAEPFEESMTPTKLCEKISGGPGFTGYKSHYSPSFAGRSQSHPDMTDEEKSLSMMVWVYPGFVAAISPNSAVYMSITPTGPTELQTRWDVIAREQVFDDGEADERLAFARSFNAEDRERLLDVQKGLASRFAERGHLAPVDLEGTVWDFYHYVANKLT